MGGSTAVRYGTFVWAQGTVGTLFTLPQGATDVDWTIIVSQSFNGGTQSVRIGDATTSNRWASSVDTGTATITKTPIVGSAVGIIAGSLTADTPVLVRPNFAGAGSATQGTLAVICTYVLM